MILIDSSILQHFEELKTELCLSLLQCYDEGMEDTILS